MDIQDSIRVLVDLKGNSNRGFDYLPILLVIFSGLVSFLIAYFTSKWTRKNDISQLTHKVDYDLKQMFIQLESGNYRILYEKKLAALKRIKEIQFTILESFTEPFDSRDEFMHNFPFKELIANMHNLIIEYSYVFNEEIANVFKDIYHDTDFTHNNYDPDSSDWYGYPDRIYKKFNNLVVIVTDNLKIDLQSIEQKVKKPST